MATGRIRTNRPGYHDDDVCVRPENLGGVSEVSKLLDQRKSTVCNWVNRRTYDVPVPIATVSATRLFDMQQWREWGNRALSGVAADRLIGPASPLRKRADNAA